MAMAGPRRRRQALTPGAEYAVRGLEYRGRTGRTAVPDYSREARRRGGHADDNHAARTASHSQQLSGVADERATPDAARGRTHRCRATAASNSAVVGAQAASVVAEGPIDTSGGTGGSRCLCGHRRWREGRQRNAAGSPSGTTCRSSSRARRRLSYVSLGRLRVRSAGMRSGSVARMPIGRRRSPTAPRSVVHAPAAVAAGSNS
jgi:hypothetical protein